MWGVSVGPGGVEGGWVLWDWTDVVSYAESEGGE